MTGWLVDTSVISAFAPGRKDKPEVPPDLAEWFRQHADEIFLSAITIAEVQDGICKLRRAGGVTRADALTEWLARVVTLYGDRVKPLNVEVALALGEIRDATRAEGHQPGFPDIGIAATAKVHGLTILTRNVKHFEPLDVPHHDPYETLPPTPSPKLP